MANALGLHHFEDRRLSKEALKNLQPIWGTSVRTHEQCQRIERIVDQFFVLNSHKSVMMFPLTPGPILKLTQSSSPEQCPSGELIFRLVDAIRRHVKPRWVDKPIPSFRTVRLYWRGIVELLKFRYDAFTINYTVTWQKRIATHLDQLCASGKLMRGRYQKREYLGFAILGRMITLWLRDAIEHGCLSWDVVVLKPLSVLIVAACAARSGDVTRSDGCNGLEYLRYEHVELRVDQTLHAGKGSRSVQTLMCKVTLPYTKGLK